MCGRVESLQGARMRTILEAVMVKPGLPWRPHYFRDTRAIKYLPRRTANREWNQPKRKKCVAINKAKGIRDLKSILTSNMEKHLQSSTRCRKKKTINYQSGTR